MFYILSVSFFYWGVQINIWIWKRYKNVRPLYKKGQTVKLNNNQNHKDICNYFEVTVMVIVVKLFLSLYQYYFVIYTVPLTVCLFCCLLSVLIFSLSCVGHIVPYTCKVSSCLCISSAQCDCYNVVTIKPHDLIRCTLYNAILAFMVSVLNPVCQEICHISTLTLAILIKFPNGK